MGGSISTVEKLRSEKEIKKSKERERGVGRTKTNNNDDDDFSSGRLILETATSRAKETGAAEAEQSHRGAARVPFVYKRTDPCTVLHSVYIRGILDFDVYGRDEKACERVRAIRIGRPVRGLAATADERH